MHTKSWLCLFCLVSVSLACSLPFSQPAVAEVTPITGPTPTVAVPAIPRDSFILKMPDGSALDLVVTSCEGVGQGGYLMLRASNDPSQEDQEPIDFQIGGGNNGPGRYDGIYVSIIIGTNGKFTFQGNNPNATIVLGNDGSGKLLPLKITNAAGGSTQYEYGNEYSFSAEWSCKP